MNKKIKQGDIGYLKTRQRYTIIRTAVYFVIVISIFTIGFITTKTRNNLLTVVAILGVLPASKSLVNAIMYIKEKPISDELYGRLMPFEKKACLLYNMLVSSNEKVRFISCVAIYDHSVFFLCTDTKTDEKKFCTYMKNLFANHGKGNVNIKMYRDAGPFCERIKTISLTEKGENAEAFEEKLISVLCAVSL